MLEAIAFRLEAIASRLEAIAISFFFSLIFSSLQTYVESLIQFVQGQEGLGSSLLPSPHRAFGSQLHSFICPCFVSISSHVHDFYLYVYSMFLFLLFLFVSLFLSFFLSFDFLLFFNHMQQRQEKLASSEQARDIE